MVIPNSSLIGGLSGPVLGIPGPDGMGLLTDPACANEGVVLARQSRYASVAAKTRIDSSTHVKHGLFGWPIFLNPPSPHWSLTRRSSRTNAAAPTRKYANLL